MGVQASAPRTLASGVEGGKHRDVEKCQQQQDADIADGQQIHNLSLRAHLRLGSRGHDGWTHTVPGVVKRHHAQRPEARQASLG